jgi:antitoxin CptB
MTALTEQEQADLRRLRWRSRRGMLELDRMFEAYLELRWPQASSEERATFERLLGCEDDRLWRWLVGHEAPDPDLDGIVGIVLDLPR